MDQESLRPCTDVIDDTVELVNKRIWNEDAPLGRINQHYNKALVDANGVSQSWLRFISTPTSSSGKITTCSLVPISKYGIPSEGPEASNDAKNHVGDKCGNFCKINVKYTGVSGAVGKAIGGVFSWTDDDDDDHSNFFEDLFEISVNRESPYCEREESYIRGFRVQLLACHRVTVENEIRAKELKITSADGSGEGSCSAAAADYAGLLDSSGRAAAALAEELGSTEALVENINKCYLASGSTVTDEAVLALDDKPNIAACHLTAARAATESAFQKLAYCEILARSYRDFYLAFDGSDSPINKVVDDVMDRCTSKCQNEDYGVELNLNNLASKIEDCAKDCYKDKLPEKLKDKLKNSYPVTDGCSAQITAPESGTVPAQFSFWGVLTMLGLLKPRQRRSFLVLASHLGVVATQILALAMIHLGCANDTVLRNVCGDEGHTDTGEVVEGAEHDELCPDPVPEDSTTTAAVLADPDSDGLLADTAGIRALTGLGESEVAAAESYVGDSLPSAAFSSAATASDSESYDKGSQSTDSGSGDTSSGSGSDAASSETTSFGGSTLGSLDSLLKPSGDSASNSASGGGSADSSAAVAGDTGKSAYSSGGSAQGSGRSPAQKSTDLSGLLGDKSGSFGYGAAGAGAIDFNAMQGSKDGKESAMASVDPENYFSLIDINASLFEIIHQRYSRESMSWSSDRAQEVLRSLTPPPSKP